MGDREGHGFRWVVPSVTIVLLAFALTLLATNILPARRNLVRMHEERERLSEEIRSLTELDARLALRARALRSDPMTQEAEFRRTFRSGRPGETVYQFEDADSEAPR